MSKILELAKRIASTGGLETKTTETISGTYDSTGQQRLLSHAYTIGANLTITNGELILSRLADNGTSMTLEFGSDVTLTGDGTLMLGDLGQGQPNQDFSASRITGTLPSSLFPAGHKTTLTQYTEVTGSGNTVSTTGIGFGTVGSQSMVNGSKIQIIMQGGNIAVLDGVRANLITAVNYKWDTTFSNATDGSQHYNAYHVGLTSDIGNSVVKTGGMACTIITNSSGSTKTLYFRPWIRSTSSSYWGRWEANAQGASSYGSITYLVTYVE